MDLSLLEEICRCLAYHAVETEITLPFAYPPDEESERQVVEAKRLIAAAGFDFDALYPDAERPVAF